MRLGVAAPDHLQTLRSVERRIAAVGGERLAALVVERPKEALDHLAPRGIGDRVDQLDPQFLNDPLEARIDAAVDQAISVLNGVPPVRSVLAAQPVAGMLRDSGE